MTLPHTIHIHPYPKCFIKYWGSPHPQSPLSIYYLFCRFTKVLWYNFLPPLLQRIIFSINHSLYFLRPSQSFPFTGNHPRNVNFSPIDLKGSKGSPPWFHRSTLGDCLPFPCGEQGGWAKTNHFLFTPPFQCFPIFPLHLAPQWSSPFERCLLELFFNNNN